MLWKVYKNVQPNVKTKMLVTARSLGRSVERNAMVFLYAEQKIFACKALIFVQTQLNVTDCHRCTGGYPTKFHSNSQWCSSEVKYYRSASGIEKFIYIFNLHEPFKVN